MSFLSRLLRLLRPELNSAREVKAFSESAIQFGDTVRIAQTPVTEKLGIAGRVGSVYGQTTPSVTGVDVVGDSGEDYAINVSLDGDQQCWFSPHLLELVHHTAGTTLRLDGIDREWTRDSQGEWAEHDR